MSHLPTISPKPFQAMSPKEWHSYVTSLRVEKEKKVVAPWTLRINSKGTPVLRINRSPQWMLTSEIESLCKEHGLKLGEFWAKVKSRCPVFSTEEEAQTYLTNLIIRPGESK